MNAPAQACGWKLNALRIPRIVKAAASVESMVALNGFGLAGHLYQIVAKDEGRALAVADV